MKTWVLQNKKWAAVICLATVCFAIKVARYNKPGQYLADIPMLILTMAVMVKFREPIAGFFERSRLPTFLLYVLVSVPFILFEENVNCLQSGCRVIPSTLPALLVFILILGTAVKVLRAKNIAIVLAVFSVLGLSYELLFGSSHLQFLPIVTTPFGIFLALWTMFSYTFIAFTPLTILMGQFPV